MDDTNNITAIHGNPTQLGEMFAALSKAQAEIDPAKKRALNPHFKSRYADLSSCLDAILPALNKHGLSLLQLVGETSGNLVTLTTILGFSNGAYISALSSIPMDKKGGPQGAGSGISYLKRYAVSALVGLGTTDDDGNEAQGRSSKPKAKAKAKVKAPPEPKAKDESWEKARPAFMASISELGLAYDEVKFICQTMRKDPYVKPSTMAQQERNKLMLYLSKLDDEAKDKWIGRHCDALEEKKHSNV